MAATAAKITGAQCYTNGKVLIGTASITLPDIKFGDLEMDALGMTGTVVVPNLRDLQALTCTVILNAASADMADFFNVRDIITVHGRANFQVFDPLNGTSYDIGEACIMEVLSKGPNLGERKNKEGGEIEIECSVISLQYSAGGIELLKLNPSAGVYRWKGTDMLATSQNNLGG